MNPNLEYWIGLKRIGTSTYRWGDGTVYGYTNWYWDEPNETGRCTRIVSDGTWRDLDCNSNSAMHSYICEMPGIKGTVALSILKVSSTVHLVCYVCLNARFF